MRTLLLVFVVLLVGIAGLGFYQGWFRLSADGTDQTPSATFTLDKDKLHEDGEMVRDTVQGMGGEVQETTGDSTDEIKQ